MVATAEQYQKIAKRRKTLRFGHPPLTSDSPDVRKDYSEIGMVNPFVSSCLRGKQRFLFIDTRSTDPINIGISASLPQRWSLDIERRGNWNITVFVGYDSSTSTWGVTQRYTYSPYGTITILNADWSTPSAGTNPTVDNLYQGMTLDQVTGLYYERNRNYSPSLGIWTSQDPDGYINGANTYQFVMSNPAGNVDPSGTSASSDAVLTYKQLQQLFNDINNIFKPKNKNKTKDGFTLTGSFNQSMFQAYAGNSGNIGLGFNFGNGYNAKVTYTPSSTYPASSSPNNLPNVFNNLGSVGVTGGNDVFNIGGSLNANGTFGENSSFNVTNIVNDLSNGNPLNFSNDLTNLANLLNGTNSTTGVLNKFDVNFSNLMDNITGMNNITTTLNISLNQVINFNDVNAATSNTIGGSVGVNVNGPNSSNGLYVNYGNNSITHVSTFMFVYRHSQ